MAANVFLPLEGAVLCVDCETISNSTSSCGKCGSQVLRPLSLWIGMLGKQETRAFVADTTGRTEVRITCCYPQFTVSSNRAIARELIAQHRAAADAEKARTA